MLEAHSTLTMFAKYVYHEQRPHVWSRCFNFRLRILKTKSNNNFRLQTCLGHYPDIGRVLRISNLGSTRDMIARKFKFRRARIEALLICIFLLNGDSTFASRVVSRREVRSHRIGATNNGASVLIDIG